MVALVEASNLDYDYVERDILARTIWGEARGEGMDGMIAVANVVLNRRAHARERGGFWWGMDIIQICQKPQQFSAWNRRDKNYWKMQQVNTINSEEFTRAISIAGDAIKGHMGDNTDGATHFHKVGETPYWSRGRTPIKQIGKHVFYRLVKD